MINETITVIQSENMKYPAERSFRPSISYPEYPFDNDLSTEKNEVYDLVRNALYYAGYDKEHYGTNSWNPLGTLIKKGDNVVLKPNLVMHINKSGDSEDCLYTHPSVVAAVIDYVIIALNGEGKIVVGDAPMQDCNFDILVKESGYSELIDYYRGKGIDVSLIDFRELSSYVKNGIRYNIMNKQAHGKVIDLNDKSEFSKYDDKHLNDLRITNYDPNILNTHHSVGKHEYYISDYILDADVIINIPKPKTHRKAGVTISLKNMIGVNVRKEYLPHHCSGSINEGGDEYKKKNIFKGIEAKLYDSVNTANANNKYLNVIILKILLKVNHQLVKLDRDIYNEGSWYGNNTISKTIVDVNKILLYADKDGNMSDEQQRKMLIIADMIVAGEKEGPLLPSRKEIGAIVVGSNPVAFDSVIATLMGMDINKIPTLKQVKSVNNGYEIASNAQTLIKSNIKSWDGKTINEIEYKDTWKFVPSDGWKGHIELTREIKKNTSDLLKD